MVNYIAHNNSIGNIFLHMSAALSSTWSAQTPALTVATGLLLELGARVRQHRTRRGMTRRALAQQSQVSARYLAQLEAGDGNASIMVLQRIAIALGVHWQISWLTGRPKRSNTPCCRRC